MKFERRRRSGIAAAVSVIGLWSAVSMAQEDNPHAERSMELLPVTLSLDRQAAEALEQRSLPKLRSVYAALRDAAEASEQMVASGGNACACDLALSTLIIPVGFAINKLDGGGRYQDWMEDESLGHVADYRDLIATCGDDAGRPANSQVTDASIRAL